MCDYIQWPLLNDSHPYIRLDYILLSPAIIENIYSHSSGSNGSGSGSGIYAGVDRSNVTDVLSDHYPVYASWSDRHHKHIPLF